MNYSLPKDMLATARAYENMNRKATPRKKGKFGFEVVPLKIGEKSAGGDAICIRWGYDLKSESPDQFVMVVDAGDKKDGPDVVKFLKEKFKTTCVDLLVNTHNHGDHFGGIESVLDGLDVKTWMVHCPWEDPILKNLVLSLSPAILKFELRRDDDYKVKDVYDLVKKAVKTKIVRPDVGLYGETKGVRITVLGPDLDYYRKMFRKISTAQPVTEDLKDFSDKDFETLTGGEDADPINATSVVIALTLVESNNKVVLLTSDATPEAQRMAWANAKVLGVSLENVRIFQVPHHGSVKNSRKDTLDAFLGRVGSDHSNSYAFASVPADSSGGHPDEKVVAAVKKRGWNYRDRQEGDFAGFNVGLSS